MFDNQLDNQQAGQKQNKLFEQKKKYKNLESDKKAYIDESVKIIKKQKTTVDKLKKQNQALKDLIAKMNKEKNQSTKTLMSETQQQKIEQLKSAIQQQQQTQKTIDMHIANFQKKITEKRKNCMGMNSGAESENNLQKQIKILENRLDKANQKFNQTTAHNKDLKNVIDSLRRQRVIFDNLYKKLEKQLHEKRKKMADIIQKANNAYQERDKAHNQIQTLKTHSKKQAEEFQKQIKQISYLMQKIKLSQYGKKNNEKLNQSVNGANFYDFEQSQPLQKKNMKQTKKGNQQIEKIHKFREDFAKIQAATQIQNFDELLRIFTENEQKNFQMFKFVNLQSNEIQQLESQLFELKKQLAKVKPQDEQIQTTDGGVSKQHFIQELEQTLANMKRNLEDTKNKYQKNQLEIRPLINFIDRIFDTIQCDRELAKQMGGGNKAITENNLLVFLAIIQHKSIKIVESYKQLSNPNMLNTGTGFGQINKGQPVNMGMLTFQDFQDNEEYNKILTAEELREKAKMFIQKEQNQKQKKKQARHKKK